MEALLSRDRRAYLRRRFFRLIDVRLNGVLLAGLFMILLYDNFRGSARRLATVATFRTYCRTTGK